MVVIAQRVLFVVHHIPHYLFMSLPINQSRSSTVGKKYPFFFWTLHESFTDPFILIRPYLSYIYRVFRNRSDC